MPRLPDVTPETLAERSIGLSGGDVLNTLVLAASAALERGAAAVSLDDFDAAIGQVRRARDEIGVAVNYASNISLG